MPPFVKYFLGICLIRIVKAVFLINCDSEMINHIPSQ